MGTDVEPYKGDVIDTIADGVARVANSELGEMALDDLDSEPHASAFDHLLDSILKRNEKESNAFTADMGPADGADEPYFSDEGWSIECRASIATGRNRGSSMVSITEEKRYLSDRFTRIVLLGRSHVLGGGKKRTFEIRQFTTNPERLAPYHPLWPDRKPTSDGDRFWKDKFWIAEVPYYKDLGTRLQRFTEHVKTWEPVGNKKGVGLYVKP